MRIRFSFKSLSMRLLLLTVVFVMVAEMLIYAPSIARFRASYLEQKLAEAHLALMALEVTPDGMVNQNLQMRLLQHAGAIAMTAYESGFYRLKLGPDMPPRVSRMVDLRNPDFFMLIMDAFHVLAAVEPRLITVAGVSPKDEKVMVAVTIEEAPLRQAMIDFSWRILALSMFISVLTAGLVYMTLYWLMVRPMWRITHAMQHFQKAPEDSTRILQASQRRDEVGQAERALARMQWELRDALVQKSRLAGMGTAVAKISHDLKGVLTTALLEADRLTALREAQQGEKNETLLITEGIAESIERAVTMCSSTLQYAREGSPDVDMQPLYLASVLTDAETDMVKRGHQLTFHLPPDLSSWPAINADPNLLARVLGNLLGNAHEAGAHNIYLARYRSGAQVQPGCLSVLLLDDGPGLPKRAIDHLFTPFSGSARAGGTGLGLPIAKELMKAMGGEIKWLVPKEVRVESVEGISSPSFIGTKGAAFVLQFSLAPAS